MLRRLLGAGRLGCAPWSFLVPLLLLATTAGDIAAQDRRPEGRGRAPVVIKAGTVHPVSGPAIHDGVVVMRGSRIVAVGAAADVQLPENATVLDYPDGHVYPGFVDAMSRGFAGDVANDGNVDAGVELQDALDRFDRESRAMAEHGVTTAYVSNRSGATWRGQGALVRPRPDGFAPFPEHTTAGVHLRLTTGPGPSHPLQRMKQLEAYGKEFEQLEPYEKGLSEYQKKLEEYQKKFEEFLAWHRKRSGKTEGEKPAETPKPAEATEPKTGEGGATPPAGERRGPRRGGRPGDGPRPTGGEPGGQGEGKPAPQEGQKPAEAPKPETQQKPGEKAPEDKEPERPKFPAEPKRDPQKDALIAVRDGKLALFVEAQRFDEVERALAIARERQIPRLVLEDVTGAAGIVGAIAAAGVPVVVQSALPPAVSQLVPDNANYVRKGDEWTSVAARLCDAGVPVAIGSGSPRRARHLPSLVAEAIGAGIPADVALRAITLTPAEILGVADRVGSIEPQKLADLVVTSAPLESSDARIVRVISSGNTVHEAR